MSRSARDIAPDPLLDRHAAPDPSSYASSIDVDGLPGATEAGRSHRDWLGHSWIPVAIAAAVSVAFLVWMMGDLGGPSVAGRVDEIGEGVAAVIGGALCLRRSSRSSGRLAASWACTGAGCLCWAAGEGVWCWFDIARGVAVPFPSLADFGFLTELPLLALGVILFPSSFGRALSLFRVILDGIIVGGALLVMSWGTVLGAAFHTGHSSRFAEAILLAYPLGDVAIATLAFSALGHAGRRGRGTLGIIITGLLALSISDSAFIYLTQTTRYNSGLIVDTGWVVGFLLLGLASLRPPAEGDAAREAQRWYSPWQILLPYLFLGAAATFIITKYLLDNHVDAFIAGVGVVVLCTVLVRQVVTLLENSRLLQTLELQTKLDPLTGIGNRLAFAERLRSSFGTPTLQPTAVFICDLDEFKNVNDSFGHAIGDEVLVAVATRLQASVRPKDLVVRLGGDEFAIVLESDTTESDAIGIALRIMSAMREPLDPPTGEVTPVVSIGLALQSALDRTHDDLLRRADVALYAAKAAGGNCYRVFDPRMMSDRLAVRR